MSRGALGWDLVFSSVGEAGSAAVAKAKAAAKAQSERRVAAAE